MGLKDAFDKAADAVEHGAEDVKDWASEAGHRGAAEGEQAKRDVAGDTLTPGERAGSVLNQGKEELLAGVDHAKRDVRDL
jgi:hypothetical protein